MCGSTRSTTSPSSSSTRRKTPCAAGCCGPKLMLNWRMSVSGIGAPGAERSRSLGDGLDARELGVFVDAGDEARPRDDHALVAAFADEVDAVVRAHVEVKTATLDVPASRVDRHSLHRTRR